MSFYETNYRATEYEDLENFPLNQSRISKINVRNPWLHAPFERIKERKLTIDASTFCEN